MPPPYLTPFHIIIVIIIIICVIVIIRISTKQPINTSAVHKTDGRSSARTNGGSQDVQQYAVSNRTALTFLWLSV